MEFNSQICTTRSQSEALLKLGLKKETADMYRPPSWGGDKIIGYYAPDVVLFNDHFAENPNDLPAWSLHRLLVMYGDNYSFFSLDNAYGELIHAIAIDIEKGDFNKDYLEEKK